MALPAHSVILVRLDEELASMVRDLRGSDQLTWDMVSTLEEAAAHVAEHDDGPLRIVVTVPSPNQLDDTWSKGLRVPDQAVKIVVVTRELADGDQLKLILAGACTVVRPPMPPVEVNSLFADTTFLSYLFPVPLRGRHREIHELEIPTDKTQVPAVIHLISARLDRAGAPTDMVRSLLPLVVDEAVTNAMEHGNEWDPTKSVFVRLTVDEDGFEIAVRDEGEGFVRNTVADPLQEDNLTQEGGRGLFLIEQLMDEVFYQNEGRTIVLRKSLRAPELVGA